MFAGQHRRSPYLLTSASAIACAAAIAVAGCGGSSSQHTTTHTQAGRQTPLQSNPDVGAARPQLEASAHGGQGVQGGHRAQAGQGGHGKAAQGALSKRADERMAAAGKVQRARGGTTDHELPATTPKPLNPCRLVSRAEAGSIAGRTVTASIEAPLGPTCVYQFSAPKSNITLTIESMSFSQVTHQMQKRTAVTVAGHRAVCGQLGAGMLFAPLSGGRVLNVTAPCSVAQRFAALALSRLTA
jgi:hypothetical protein